MPPLLIGLVIHYCFSRHKVPLHDKRARSLQLLPNFSLLVTTMSGIHYRRHNRNQKDDWEKRRLAAVKRLNKSNKGGRQTQPQAWTLQYYMLEWHEREWRLQPLQHAVKSTHDRLRYAAEHEWSTLALQTQLFACVSGQSQ